MWKLRWRGVECVYTDAELELIRGWIEQAENGLVKPSEVANRWDILQEAKLHLDARLVEDARSEPSLYELLSEPLTTLPPAFKEGLFRLPDDVIGRFEP